MISLKSFRIIALTEATSFLLLLGASYIKNTGGSEAGVQILGPIHGILFLAYIVVALGIREAMRWDGRTTFLVLLGAVLPFGGYVADWRLPRNPPSADAAN
ncbi:MAG: DUF3817 domain-containing protein [Solirubrobacterales bacterium]